MRNTTHRSVIVAAALVAGAMVSAAQATQQALTHTASIDLSAYFNGTSPSGLNPLSVAFDGTNAYVGGFNNTGAPANVGVLKVANVVGTGDISAANIYSFGSNASRGINDMGYDPATARVYMAYDSGSAATSTITGIDGAGTQAWQVSNPGGQRPFALAIDPVGTTKLGNPYPVVGFLAQGQGRRLGLNVDDGSLLYTASGGANPGGIINGSPTQYGTAWRGMAFDSAGNIAIAADKGDQYGLRQAANQFKTIGGTLNATGSVVGKSVLINNIGQGMAIMEGVDPAAGLLAFAVRGSGGGNAAPVTLTDSAAGTTNISTASIQIRNVNGTPTALTQTQLLGGEDGLGASYTSEVKNVAFGKDSFGNPVLLVVSFFENRLDVYTITPQWKLDAGGNWTDPGNWTGGVPNAINATARFGSVITAGRSVNVDSNVITGGVVFDNSNVYSVGGAGTITIDVSAGNTGRISSTGTASHAISAPVTFNDDSNLSVSAGILSLSGALTNTGKILYKNGTGEVVLSGPQTNSPGSVLALNAGTVTMNVAAAGYHLSLATATFNANENQSIGGMGVIDANTANLSTAAGTTTMASSLTLLPAATLNKTGDGTYRVTGMLTSSADAVLNVKAGVATLDIDPGAAGAEILTINVGQPPAALAAPAGTSAFAATVPTLNLNATSHVLALNINAGALANLNANGLRVLSTPTLSIAGDTSPQGRLDLFDNKLVLRYGANPSPLATITAQVNAGRNGYDANIITKWDGQGIISSTARTQSVAAGFDLFSLGAINNKNLADPSIGRDKYSTFGGLTVDANTVLVRYTYSGDGDLNGQVDGDDYALIDNAFNALIPNFGWLSGDFNYDGNINGDDYALIDSGFLFQTTPIPAAAAVPEPAALGLAALAAIGSLARRRR